MTKELNGTYDAIFIGAGVIGLACAWRAAQGGARVCLLERESPGAGATGVAAGMLAPVGEASWGEERILALNFDSLRRWPGFAEQLEEEAELQVGFVRHGALHVALDRDEAAELRRRYQLHRSLGLDSEWLTARRCRDLEPGLATAVRGGAHVPGEASVDPRKVVAALTAALERRGVDVHSGTEAAAAERRGDTWRVQAADGRTFEGAELVLATGCWSGQAPWVEERLPVRPVKGEVLTLRGSADDPACERIVAGERVYLVPRSDGRLIVGATVEERGFETTVSAGGVHELLREAYRVIPQIAELELAEASAGLRPGSPDNAPLIGRAADGLLVATGHFRNGVLQAPATADAITALLAGNVPPVDLASFSPLRFARRSTNDVVEVV